MKVINARIVEKTMAEKYFKISGSLIYGGMSIFSYLYFTGTHAEELNKRLEKFIKNKTAEEKVEWGKKHKEEIGELENKLLTVVDGWFKKPSIQIKKDLAEKRLEQFRPSDFLRSHYESQFLSTINCVKVGESENSSFYEILSL